MYSVLSCDISSANSSLGITPSLLQCTSFSKIRRKFGKQDTLKRKILPESPDIGKCIKYITGYVLLESETKIGGGREKAVFAHGDNCQKPDFKSVVAKNSKLSFIKYQLIHIERRTLILMSY